MTEFWGGGLRWSYTDPAWLGLFRTLHDGRVYLRHEMVFHGVTPELAASMIAAKVRAWNVALAYIVGNHEMWPKDGESGECVAETFSRAGLPMMRGSKDRLNRWSRLRSWLEVRTWTGTDGAFDAPTLTIHPSCTRLLRTLPTLTSDGKNRDDVEETPDEYPAAGVSLFAMSRPMPPQDAMPELPEGAVGHLVNELRAEIEAGV